MGSCISKCRPKRKKFKTNFSTTTKEDFSSHIHDKLVISQAPAVSPSPSSVSSFSGATTTGSGLSTSSSSSSSSSVLISKDRSFSNEFLRSCAKENPHIIGTHLIRGQLVHPPPQVLELTTREICIRQVPVPEKKAAAVAVGSTPRKRIRANSPTVVRQKSFRLNSTDNYHFPSRTLRSSPSPSRGLIENADQSRILRSPSPSRRFNVDQSFRDSYYTSTMNYKENIRSKNSAVSKPFLRKEISMRSPSDYSKERLNVPSKNNQIGSRIDENIAVHEEKENHGVEAMTIEDFNNPLIALDCFIFL